MDKRSYELIGSPCGHHGQYTFYKAIRLTAQRESIVAIGDFFFVRIWQDSELVSIGELQLLWTDRVSDQTLVSLRLYFLPENTPDGRNLHGQDEVLAINDKVVVRAEDLLSWMCDGSDWHWGLRAVWRGACTAPADPRTTQPLHHTKLDFADVEKEKNAIVDPESPGVVVFSYPQYCRYRALLARLEGIQADWLRDSLVAALGGYAAPTKNTRILYCKDTFEYPELEGNECVCNHLAPKLKGRPRGRRRRRARSRSDSPSSRSSDSDVKEDIKEMPRVTTSRRLSLRNGAPERERKSEEDEEDIFKTSETTSEDRAFLQQLKNFYKERNESVKIVNSLNVSLRRLYTNVVSRGGYEAVCRHKLWRSVHTAHPSSPPLLALPTPDQPARVRRVYERYLLPFETYERRNGLKLKISNGRKEPTTIDTIDVTDSPLREDTTNTLDIKHNTLRTPSPKLEKELSIDQETGEPQKDDLNIIVKPAEELNREFLESLPKEDEKFKITIKPVEKLIDNNVMSIISFLQNVDVVKLFEDNCVLINELVVKHNLTDSSKVIDEVGRQQVSDASAMFLKELAQKLNLGNIEYGQQLGVSEAQRQMLVGEGQLGQAPGQGQLGALQSLSTLGDKYAVNGHTSVSVSTHTNTEQKVRPAGRSSLRAVRVKPTRQPHAQTPPIPPVRSDSSGSPPGVPPLNNFGIHRPPSQPTTLNNNSDDEIVEVPYKPKTPEIIDLDEYPESPQGVKKKKLDILKERGLEVTAIPTAPAWGTIPPVINPIAPLIPNQMILNPAVQHQIMTQAQLFQMYNIIPPNYANGIQPPKVIQATSAFGSSGPEKTVYGNPKDPFMPPPHVLLGTPIKPLRTVQSTPTPPQDILDLTCKNANESPQKPAVEIVRVPTVPSPKTPTPQNLSKNYTLIDGKAVVGSNLEITLVNPKNQTPPKNRQPQKRSSNGKFVSAKTPTPPKDYPKSCGAGAPTPPKKPPIVVPNYQINRDDVSPTSSTGSRDSQSSNFMKNHQNSLAQMMDMQKSAVPSLNPFIDPIYMSALYSSLAGQVDQRQLAVYRDLMANQVRGYSGLLNMGVATPTTKN